MTLLVCPTCGDVVGSTPTRAPDPDVIVRDGVTDARLPAATDDHLCLNCWEEAG